MKIGDFKTREVADIAEIAAFAENCARRRVVMLVTETGDVAYWREGPYNTSVVGAADVAFTVLTRDLITKEMPRGLLRLARLKAANVNCGRSFEGLYYA